MENSCSVRRWRAAGHRELLAGCAVYRRESGAQPDAVATSGDRATPQRSLGGALVVTAILLLLATAGLTLLHETAAQRLRERIPGLRGETSAEGPPASPR